MEAISVSGSNQHPNEMNDRLKPLGLEGWEAVHYKPFTHYTELHGVSMRRDPNSRVQWEHKLIDLTDLPDPDFRNHLQSCGWERVDQSGVYDRRKRKETLFKRPQKWFGSDDGDIRARLRDLGLSKIADEVSDMSTNVNQAMAEILALKWHASVAAGHNIGTYNAVRAWIVGAYVPWMIAEECDLEVGFDKRDAELEELLARWQNNGGDVSTLRDAVKQWARLRQRTLFDGQ